MQPDPGYTEFAEGAAPPERLTDRLAKGRLPLDQVLGCAADVALALRDLHASGRAHGSVAAVFVALEPSRAVLLPAPGNSAAATKAGDVAAFGALLYELLTSRKPSSDAFSAAAVRSPYPPALTHVYHSALRVSEKCLTGDPAALPDLRNVATEVRLLLLIARRPARRPGTLQPPPLPRNPVDSDDPNVTLTDLICPRCGGDDVHTSGHRSGFERFLSRFDVSFFRCHRCFHRFMVLFGIKIRMAEPM